MKTLSNSCSKQLLKHPASNARRMPDAVLDVCSEMPLRTAYSGLRTPYFELRTSICGFRFAVFDYDCKVISCSLAY
jgi:hypothetical protein